MPISDKSLEKKIRDLKIQPGEYSLGEIEKIMI